MLFVAVTCAFAQKAEIFGGYAVTRFDTPYVSPAAGQITPSSINGWNASLTGNVNRFFGFTTDVAGGYTKRTYTDHVCIQAPCSQPAADLKFHTVMFGPQVRIPVSHFVLFGRGLVGVGRSSGKVSDGRSLGSDTSLAFGLGGGLDYKLNRFVAFRAGQLDYIRTSFGENDQSHVRYSTGLVLRF